MGYMETYSPCRAQEIPGVLPERYDFAQAPCHHEFGVVMLPHEEADAKLPCTFPVVKALPKWYLPYPGQSPFERIFHDSEVCRVPEDTMHDFRYEADWYQLGTLVMTIMLYGLALCQPKGQGQVRSRTEDDDNGLRGKQTKTDNHGQIGMRKRKQVIHTGKWMLLPSLCPMILLLQLRMTTASEDDNVMTNWDRDVWCNKYNHQPPLHWIRGGPILKIRTDCPDLPMEVSTMQQLPDQMWFNNIKVPVYLSGYTSQLNHINVRWP